MSEVLVEQPDNSFEPLTLRQRFAASRLGRVVVGGLAAAGLATGVVALAASPAQAESSHTYTVEDTNGEGLWLHSDPGFDDGSDLIMVVPEGTNVAADCYVHDSPVGSANNSAWLRVTYQGTKGFVADAYTNSVWDEHNTLHDQGLELCRESQPATTSQFKAAAGVAWAVHNARQPQEGGIQSPWFVSNALWHAGLPKTKAWTEQSDYWNGTRYFDGILAAHAASNLVTYLEENTFVTRQNVGSITNSAIPGAQTGDVIAYDWQGDGYIDHLALVVGHDSDNPAHPMVAEWGQFAWDGLAGSTMSQDNGVGAQSSYSERAWDRSGLDSRQLAEVYPNATAQLLHINGN